MRISRILSAVFPLLLAFIACSCSDTSLSRGKAAELIKANKDAATERTVFIILTNGLYLGGQEGHLYKAFAKSGYLAIGRGKTELTKKGQSAAAASKWKVGGCGFRPRCVYVPVARRSFGETAGIIPREKEATAEFVWSWQLTELGREITSTGFTFSDLHPVYGPFDPTKPSKGSASFVLYDDGWRVRAITW